MTAKQWLMRAWKLDREISSLIRARDSTRERVMSITQNYSAIMVGGTKDPHKYDRLMELENRIDQRIDELVGIKEEVIAVISQVDDNRYRLILQERYIECKTFEQIAVDGYYSWRHTLRLHGKALKAVEPHIVMYLEATAR